MNSSPSLPSIYLLPPSIQSTHVSVHFMQGIEVLKNNNKPQVERKIHYKGKVTILGLVVWFTSLRGWIYQTIATATVFRSELASQQQIEPFSGIGTAQNENLQIINKNMVMEFHRNQSQMAKGRNRDQKANLLVTWALVVVVLATASADF